MLLLLAAMIGTCGGLWHGGKLGNFARLDFRWPLIFLAGLLLRTLAFSRVIPDNALAIGLYSIAVASLIVGVAVNRQIAGIELVLIGLLLNSAVILANGGAMPVSADALRSAGLDEFALQLRAEGQIGHAELTTPNTRLRSLADIIPLTFLPGFRAVGSVGDLFIAAGTLVIFYIGTLRPPMPRKRASNTPDDGDTLARTVDGVPGTTARSRGSASTEAAPRHQTETAPALTRQTAPGRVRLP